MKFTLLQWHTSTISPVLDGAETRYYDLIWSQEYYHKPDAFWELPKWAGELSYCLDKNRVYHTFRVLRKVESLKCDIAFGSVLDSNKMLYKQLATVNKNVKFIFGGYIDWEYFSELDNVYSVDSIEDCCKMFGWEYHKGVSWTLFKGEKCIPRITLSDGCRHRCKFCTIPNKVNAMPEYYIDVQIEALKDLDFELIYVDDKTFGQCSNYTELNRIKREVDRFNDKFKGFIVQTTATTIPKIDWDKLPVYAIEMGVESYNDEILKEMRKPASVRTIDKAVRVILDAGIKYIPNIIIGLPSETRHTYLSTLNHLLGSDILHANVYSLAVYDDAELSGEIDKKSEHDGDETTQFKSYNTELKNKIDKTAYELIIECLIKKLK